MRATRKTSAAALALSAMLLAGTGFAQAKAAPVNLLETGSTLWYPLFELWAPAYHHLHSNVTITPSGTGSGAGISDAMSGSVQIGASDAYMSTAEVRQAHGILNIPLAISAQVISYNLPGLNKQHVKLNPTILADIYTGKVTKWNAPVIRRANPGVKLPNHAIIPVRRSDSSGDSFLFTSYMTDGARHIWNVGFSTSPAWPSVATEQSATGNGGMVEALHGTPYSIAYVGISYLKDLALDHLTYAMLENKAGHYVLPTARTIGNAAQAIAPKTPANERISLVFAPGAASYPIINYEYAIVQPKQSSATVRNALTTFLFWAIQGTGGNQAKFLNKVHFLPLPSSIRKLLAKQVAGIRG